MERISGLGPLFLLVLALVAGCAGRQRLERVQSLTEEGRALFAKYRQFLTETQQDAFLALDTDDERRAWIANLRIEERLSRYPKEIQDAIWAQEVVPGMDREAVLLTWSTPLVREIDEAARSQGQDVDRWTYRRFDRYVEVVFTNGVVTAVNQASR